MSRPSAAIDHDGEMRRVLSEMDEIPLFMKGLNTSVDQNATLAALQSLAYEGEPLEVAANFKSHGTELFQEKKYRDAAEYYSKALLVCEEQEESGPEWKDLRNTLYLNRAMCHLRLENYRKVLDDTAQVLKEKPSELKALYRAASALLALERYKEAFDACQRGIENKQDKDFDALKARIIQAGAAAQRREEERVELRKRRARTEKAITQGLELRNIISKGLRGEIGPAFDPSYPSIQNAPPLSPPELASTWQAPKAEMAMVFPVYFIYPEFEITEVITEFHEADTFIEQLARMFPDSTLPPEILESVEESLKEERVGEGYGHQLAPGMDPKIWRAGNLQVYTTLSSGCTTRLGAKLQLDRVIRVLREGKDMLVLLDGALHFYILPKVGSTFTKKWLSQQKAASTAAATGATSRV